MKSLFLTVSIILLFTFGIQAQNCYCHIYGMYQHRNVPGVGSPIFWKTVVIQKSECLENMNIIERPPQNLQNDHTLRAVRGVFGGTVLTQENMQGLINEIRGLTNALTQKINTDRENMRTEVAENNKGIRNEVINKLDALPRNIISQEVMELMKEEIKAELKEEISNNNASPSN